MTDDQHNDESTPKGGVNPSDTSPLSNQALGANSKPAKPSKSSTKPPTKSTASSATKSSFNMVLNMVVLLLMGYGLYEYMNHAKQQERDIAQGQVFAEQAVGANVDVTHPNDPRIEQLYQQRQFDYAATLVPVTRPAVHKTMLKEGDGPAALCGQNATYRTYDGELPGEPQTMRIGDRSNPLGMSLGLQGMRPGEIRQLMIPSRLFKQNSVLNDKEIKSVKLELLSLHPTPTFAQMRLRRFVLQSGASGQLRCGDIAIAHLTLWDSNGEKILDTAANDGMPIWFEMGMGQVPFGIESGALRMTPGGVYTLVMPQSMFTPLNPPTHSVAPPEGLAVRAFPSDIAWPKDRAVIVDISMPKEVAMAPIATASETPDKPRADVDVERKAEKTKITDSSD